MSQLYLFACPAASLDPEPWADWPVCGLPPGQRWRGVSLHSLQRTHAQIEAALAQTSGLILWATLAAQTWQLSLYRQGQRVWASEDGQPQALAALLGLSWEGLQSAWQQTQLTPVAHLAAVLRALGWETAFAEVSVKAQPEAPPACACAAVAAAPSAAVPVAEPLLLPLSDLRACFRLAWLISDQAHPLLWLPEHPPLDWPIGATSHVHDLADGVQIGLDTTGMPFPIFAWFDEALTLLAPQLRAGQRLVLQTADIGDDPDPAASQRWEFVVQPAGELALQATFPALTPSVLQAAWALSRWVDSGGPWAFASAAALQAFMEQARQRDELWLAELETTATTLSHAESWQRAFIARDIFLDSLGDSFDVQRARALRQQLSADNPFSALAQTLTRALRRPAEGLLWAGVSGRFLAGLPDQLSPSEQQTLRVYTEDLAALGFGPLCDLVWEPGGDVFMRVLVSPQASAYAAILLGVVHQVGEFESVFANDTHVTTTQLPQQTHRDEPPQRVYSHPDLNLSELWQAHQQHVTHEGERMACERVAVTPDRDAFLAAFDARLARQFRLRS